MEEEAAARERRLTRRGASLLILGPLGFVPLVVYPGNWSDTFPPTAQAISVWNSEAVLVFLGLGVASALLLLGLLSLLQAWAGGRDAAAEGRRTALARVVLARRNRGILLASALGYALFFGVFSGVLGVAPGGDIVANGYPSATEYLCCGPIGTTPGLVVVMNHYVQLSFSPGAILMGIGGTVILGMNVTATAETMRHRAPRSLRSVAGVAGAFGAFFTNCPTCGTIILVNALAGTGAAGLLLGWTIFQAPLLLVAFPLGGLSLYLMAPSLAPPGCETSPAPLPPSAPTTPPTG